MSPRSAVGSPTSSREALRLARIHKRYALRDVLGRMFVRPDLSQALQTKGRDHLWS
jgi:hypothetical protein